MIAIFSTLILCIAAAYQWQAPDANWGRERNAWECIYNDPLRKRFDFQDFAVDLVENSSPKCINPYFPTIYIQTIKPHNAWLHIVYTDSKEAEGRLKVFIDSENLGKNKSPYPFYSLEKDFYDAPLWKYTLFYKPLSFWRGHAWAVLIDRKNKTIKPIGGICWGFKLSYTKLRPTFISPSSLDKNTWVEDWSVVQTKLDGFREVE